MIAKCFAAKNPGSSSILRLVNYITHDQGKVSRVGEVSVVNCHADDPYMAAEEMRNRQEMNTRAKGDKTFHLMLSFRPGETPAPEAMKRIEQLICAGLGYEEHQRVSVVHSDTDSTHIHLAINKIHPTKNTMHCPRYPYKILAAMCKDLEREFSLRQDNHEPKKTVGENKAQDMERMSGTESLVSWIRRECLEGLQQADSWGDCHEMLKKHGLVLKPRGAGMIFVSDNGVTVKASTVDRGLSKKNLEDRFGGFAAAADAANEPGKTTDGELKKQFKKSIETTKTERDAEITGIKKQRDSEIAKAKLEYEARAARARAMTGKETRFTELAAASEIYKAQVAAVRRNARERLDAVYNAPPPVWSTWLAEQAKNGSQEAQRILQSKTDAETAKVKTNAVAMEATGKNYQKGTPVKPAAAELREEFTARLEIIKTERDAEILRIKERRDRELARLKLECEARIARARASAGRATRSAEIAGALKIHKAHTAIARQKAKEDISAAYKSMPRQTWLTWLQEQAKNGRPEAIRSLRSRAYAEAMKITNSLQGEADNAAGVVIPDQKIDSVTKNGNVIYCVGNDAVKDTGKQLALSREASQDTIVMALRMAQQRFKGALFISGTPEYRERVINAAVAANLRVRFENSDIEARRRQLIHAKNTLTNSQTKKGKEME